MMWPTDGGALAILIPVLSLSVMDIQN